MALNKWITLKKGCWYGLIVFCTLLLLSCGKEANKNKLITISKETSQNTLFYSGIVEPRETIVITSPAEGVITEMPIQYGESVKAGQLLFTISSAKFLSDYKSALLQYIKAKSEFNSNQTQLNESTFLHDHQLISDDDFKNKESTYYASRLALLQAKDALESLLKQLDVKGVDLYQLSISDVNKITDAMHLQMSSENLHIIAPAAGVILASNKSEDESKKIVKGDMVKQGDVLAIIGDLSGLTVHVKVNELTVNELRIGQKVSVTGIAFPEDILSGEIKRVDRQGQVENNGLPTFSVEILVPKLTRNQQDLIHVGMSAKVEINIDESSQIMLPFAAIKEKDGSAFVKKFNKKLKTFVDVEIKTGKTSIDKVAILSGLKPGDKIAATYQV